MKKIISSVNNKIIIDRVPLQELFEMMLLKWITYDELKEYIISYLNNDSNKSLSSNYKKEYWNTCMSRAQQVVEYLKPLIGNFDPAPGVDACEHYSSLHKANDKPIISGQPRRFTKAFIPWEALISSFKYDAYVSKSNSIIELEKYVDSNYDRINILRIVYIEGINDYTRDAMERISCINAGAGMYDDIDAWLLGITACVGCNPFDSMYSDITPEDIGILF